MKDCRKQDAANPVMAFYRFVFEEHLISLMPERASVVDVGGGTAETAFHLAERGFSVRRILEAGSGRTRQWADRAQRSMPGAERWKIEASIGADLAYLHDSLDAAYAFPDAPERDALPMVCEWLSRALRKGGFALLTLPSRRVGFGWIRRRDYLAPPRSQDVALRWRPYCSLGWLMPGPENAAWAQSHPQAFGALAAIERPFRRQPLIRGCGQYTLWLGWRS
ncbi:MAG: hypothetical protein JXO72_03525 [Vicinamibacteria bacterium]|nr:hypothetical protein [Vicinamibacteria bacterium]